MRAHQEFQFRGEAEKFGEALLFLDGAEPPLRNSSGGSKRRLKRYGGFFPRFKQIHPKTTVNGRSVDITIYFDNPGISNPFLKAINSKDRLLACPPLILDQRKVLSPRRPAVDQAKMEKRILVALIGAGRAGREHATNLG